jgi:DNA-binding transcriptional LysR family regulator
MELTPLGKALAQPVREILLNVQSRVIARPDFDPASAERDFVIRASDYLTTVLLVDVVQRLQREGPKIRLHIANMTDDVPAQLNRGEVDLVIYPSASVNPRHPSETLFEETYTCVVWAQNGVVSETLSFDQYFELGHVAAAFGERSISFESMAITSRGLRRSVEVTTTNFNTLPQLVIGTSRIATIHTRLAEIYARYLPLRVLPVPFDLPPLVEVMQWHGSNSDDPAHTWMRRLIKEVADGRAGTVRI